MSDSRLSRSARKVVSAAAALGFYVLWMECPAWVCGERTLPEVAKELGGEYARPCAVSIVFLAESDGEQYESVVEDSISLIAVRIRQCDPHS